MNFQVRLTLRSGPDLPFPTHVTVGIASVPSERIRCATDVQKTVETGK